MATILKSLFGMRKIGMTRQMGARINSQKFLLRMGQRYRARHRR